MLARESPIINKYIQHADSNVNAHRERVLRLNFQAPARYIEKVCRHNYKNEVTHHFGHKQDSAPLGQDDLDECQFVQTPHAIDNQPFSFQACCGFTESGEHVLGVLGVGRKMALFQDLSQHVEMFPLLVARPL